VFDRDPSTVRKGHNHPHPIFGPCLLWPNGWMDQDATWYGGKRRLRRCCVRWGHSSPPLKWAQPPVFGSCLLWPNDWMDEDATWYRSRPRPRGNQTHWYQDTSARVLKCPDSSAKTPAPRHFGTSQWTFRHYSRRDSAQACNWETTFKDTQGHRYYIGVPGQPR